MLDRLARGESLREAGMRRAQILIQGIVQGVGFRPFVYGLAKRWGLKGWVLNDERGVQIEVEGEEDALDGFLGGLRSPPPLARVERIDLKYLPPVGYADFEIRESLRGDYRRALISPDIATCEDCLRELFDPRDRRFRYPFINCTNCGPRFTIIKDVPYDREKTTMAPFQMCPQCLKEYHDPADRRFHAQPNACPLCGPRVRLLDGQGRELQVPDPIVGAISLLKEGAIVAVKGLGGYHLACDAYDEGVVSRLRRRKYREDKPFALMCRDLAVAFKLCHREPGAEELLEGRERPIVILPQRASSPVAPSVAPGHKTLGVMLPYTPLHHLLMSDGLECLVMTSGNVSDEPIAYKDAEALERLRGIADYFLVHNRAIHMRCDDSVLKPFRGAPLFIRRSRGYVPHPVKLRWGGRMVLACGAELKNTFCLTKGEYAFVGHHIGDLENFETLRSFQEGIEHFKRLFEIEPEVVAYDLHPNYLSTRYALELDLPKVRVQHHFAHALSCMAEHGLEGPLLAAVMDGTGYGTDGAVWGCEFMEVTLGGYRRLGHLRYIPMPGGERAIKEPWRMAAVYLERALGDLSSLMAPFLRRLPMDRWELLRKAVRAGINAPLCSSMGRLFDAVSSLLGVRQEVNYEGQAAIELEQLAEEAEGQYPFSVLEGEGSFVLDPDPLIVAVAEEIQRGTPPGVISMRFHRTVAEMVMEALRRMREESGLQEVVLSGGVFQNLLLLRLICEGLERDGFRVYLQRQVPPNDGGISLGQALYALCNGGG